MRRFRGDISLFFIIALALLIALSFFIIGHIQQRVSLFSYEQRINLAMVLDNTGSGLLGFLNSGKGGIRHMETLGASAAGGQGADFGRGLGEGLEDLKAEMKQRGYGLKVLVSGKEVKRYGGEPPEGATAVETDIPLPCKGDGGCRGRAVLGVW